MGGSCANAGYEACCSFRYSSNFCRGDDDVCMCDDRCTLFGDCCTDHLTICPGLRSSCVAASYSDCCTSGDCFGATRTCKCDALCRSRGDCCDDIETTCPAFPVTTPPTTTDMETTMEVTTNPTTTPSPTSNPPATVFLPFLNLSSTVGVQTFSVPRGDDTFLGPVAIPTFFPFGSSYQTSAYVSINGIISFGQPFASHNSLHFPGLPSVTQNAYLLAPFWSDVDTTLDGMVQYEVHASGVGNDGSDALLDQVSQFVANSTGTAFVGTWMLVAEWRGVHPYPGTTTLGNTFQAIAITDDTLSYSVFTYRCGMMDWSGRATMGYNSYGNTFYNHPLSGSFAARNVACLNAPVSLWSNVLLNLTAPITVTPAPPTFLPSSNSMEFVTLPESDSMALDACYSCSSAPINLTDNPFPFGTNYHTTAYINVHGVISFSSAFNYQLPSLFTGNISQLPSSPTPPWQLAFAVAPFWASTDSRPQGGVRYRAFRAGQGSDSDELLRRVSAVVNNRTSSTDFSGSWMLVATWQMLGEFRREENPEVSPFTNTFQAITITDGSTKSYAVFVYECGALQWSGSATIGFTAGGVFQENHPYSGTNDTYLVACINSPTSNFVNLVYDLVPDPSQLGSLPPAVPPYGQCFGPQATGTPSPSLNGCFCGLDGSMECVADYLSRDCFCDRACVLFQDCCSDVNPACNNETAPDGTMLLLSDAQTLRTLNLQDGTWQIVFASPSSNIVASDYDSVRGYVYFSDSNFIRRINLDGSNLTDIVFTGNSIIGGLAIDWVTNNLYWTVASSGTIRVLDLDSMESMELLKTGNGSIPAAITVDPQSSYVIWINGGAEPTIERASLDGSDRHTLHSLGLYQPTGLTMDHLARRIYWTDWSGAYMESSFFDGSRRRRLISGFDLDTGVLPFLVTLERRVLYWTDLASGVIYATNKEALPFRKYHRAVEVYNGRAVQNSMNFTSMVSISSTRQIGAVNPCDGNNCSHLCLPVLSLFATRSYVCACPDGGVLNDDGFNCSIVVQPSSSSSIPPTPTLSSISSSSSILIRPTATSTMSVPTSSLTPTSAATTTSPFPSSSSSSSSSSMIMPVSSTSTMPSMSSSSGSTSQLTTSSIITPTSTTAVVQNPTSTSLEVKTTSTSVANPLPSSTQAMTTKTTAESSFVPSSSESLSSSASSSSNVVVPTSSSKAMPSSTGTSPATTPPPQLPGAVRNMNVVILSEKQVSVSWEGVPGVSVYLVQVWNYTGDVVWSNTMNYFGLSIDGVYTQRVAEGIEPYKPYLVSVTGYNEVGPGVQTNSSTFIFTAQAVPPVAPELEQPVRTPKTISLKWKRLTPDLAWGIVTNYTISFEKILTTQRTTKRQISTPDRDVKVVDASETRALLENVDDDFGYSIVMWANTTAGKGKSSPTITIDALDTSPPGTQSGVNGAAIAGGVIGGIIFMVLCTIVVLAMLWILRRRNKVNAIPYDETSEHSESDKAMIVATSFKQVGSQEEEDVTIVANPLSNFDNPVYELTGGRGLPPTSSASSYNETAGSDPESEMVKEDLSIGRPLNGDDIDDIEL